MKSIAISLCAAVLLAMFLSVPVSASDMGDKLASACSTCHSTKKVCRKLGTMSSAQWKRVINGMIRAGAKLPKSDVDAAAAYLGALAPGTGKVCDY